MSTKSQKQLENNLVINWDLGKNYYGSYRRLYLCTGKKGL